ncbi:MAG: hypothetical protein FWC84_03815, partial [Alphaproteobacteria bacterium]|nr:hypothetical protein [Alphaproteobacteria bacterium]
MQNSAFQFRLIVIIFIAFASIANAEVPSNPYGNDEIRSAESQQHQPAEPSLARLSSRLVPWSTIFPEQQAPAAGNPNIPMIGTERSEDVDAYTKRSTEAAEAQAVYSKWQAYIGVFGAIASLLAAFFTARAAYAARQA